MTDGPVANTYRCGTAALVGRPNVGKSTLLNALIGWRLSIVSPKPQTTRHRILGVLTNNTSQILFLDTPGMHKTGGRALNRQLNKSARQTLAEADVVVQVAEAGRWTSEDQAVYEASTGRGERPHLLALNKIDAKKDKKLLLPFIAELNASRTFDGIFLVSARQKDGLDELLAAIRSRLPLNPPAFADDEITDRSERFLAAELIREQVMRQLSQELPYSTTVEIEDFREGDERDEIDAVIWVEREGQKAIVIGEGGLMLKAIGTAARKAMLRLFEKRVHLRLWVKVRENWSDDEGALRRFGISD
ncbi:MAG TPA: GTPase Era [Rudaea sp.]|jgi:GTP-binding protein Era|nr:GTPase Era [Rudaea sp.]